MLSFLPSPPTVVVGSRSFVPVVLVVVVVVVVVVIFQFGKS